MRCRVLWFTSGAANASVSEFLAQPANKALMQRAQYFYIECYSMKGNLEAMMTIAEFAAANDRVLVLNLSAPYIVKFFAVCCVDQLRSAFYTLTT